MSDEEVETMTGQEAIEHIKDFFGIPSYYAMAKALSDDDLTIQPIQISNYFKGKMMSQKVANRFEDVYGVIINTVYTPGVFAK